MTTDHGVLISLRTAHAGNVDTHFRRQEGSVTNFFHHQAPPRHSPSNYLNFFFRKCNNSTSKRGESVLLSVLLVLRTDFLSSHKWRTVPLTEGAAQLELQPFTGWTSAHSFINKTSCGKEALIFASDFSFSGPDARGEQEPDMFTSVGDCEPGARLREQEWLPMADPPADGFDFMCEPSRGSLIQHGAFIQPRECPFPRRVWSFLRASA